MYRIIVKLGGKVGEGQVDHADVHTDHRRPAADADGVLLHQEARDEGRGAGEFRKPDLPPADEDDLLRQVHGSDVPDL